MLHGSYGHREVHEEAVPAGHGRGSMIGLKTPYEACNSTTHKGTGTAGYESGEAYMTTYNESYLGVHILSLCPDRELSEPVTRGRCSKQKYLAGTRLESPDVAETGCPISSQSVDPG
jgi:hypothetical protein